jgi:periplasmic divalent cation tolerance protein
MKSAHKYALVFVTVPDLKTARKLTQLALQNRLVACGNLIPRLESHYWWRGRIERGGEVLILFKTARTLLHHLEELILANHPYDTPEIITVALSQGTSRYLEWLASSIRPAR